MLVRSNADGYTGAWVSHLFRPIAVAWGRSRPGGPDLLRAA
jgi:hypothetical protein